MNKILFYIFFFIIITNCTLKKVEKHHGFHYLDKKQEKLNINISNKNDILSILGPPSTKSSFDNNLWIYIERKKTRSATKLGRKSSYINNVLLLEIDNRGLLVYKKLYNIDDMQDINFIKDETEISYSKKSFIYDFLSSMRQKINDPLGKRKKP